MRHLPFHSNCVWRHLSRRVLMLAALALAISLPARPASAQAAGATLIGTVTDESGAVVPDAQIVVRNVLTALERQVTSDRSGAFVVPFLQPGTYNVAADRQGFAKTEVRDVLLNVNDQRVVAIQLKVGAATESVTVSREAIHASVSPSVGTVVDRQFLATMPLNGRSLHALLQLVPGVLLVSGGNATGQTAFSVNGQRTSSNNFMVDGVSANAGIASGTTPGASASGITPTTTALGGTNGMASLDSIQEFRVETSTFSPEFGRTPGAQVSVVTRSGTNDVHGSLAEYFRHDALDANDWFGNRDGVPKPKERQYLFSGVIGGPLRRNRAFFFASYERLRLDQPRTLVASVPTAELRAVVPAGVRPFVNALPLPSEGATGIGFAPLTASFSDPGSFDISALRVDGQLRSGLTSFVRVNHAPSDTATRNNSLSNVTRLSVDNDSVTGGATWVARPNITIDARMNWTRNQPQAFFDLVEFGGNTVPSSSDFFRPGWDYQHQRFTLSMVGNNFSWGPVNDAVQQTLNAVGSLAWIKDRHNIKVGVDYGIVSPRANFVSSEVLGVGRTVTDLLNGLAPTYSLTNVDPRDRRVRFTTLSGYTQDAWNLASNLTLTYGLRFEYVPAPSEQDGILAQTVIGIETDPPTDPRLAPAGTSLFHRGGEIAPRMGAAYQLNKSSDRAATLRGGFGVFYDLGLGSVMNGFVSGYPFTASVSKTNLPLPLPDSARVLPVPGTSPPTSLTVLSPDLRLPYTRQWNVAYEQAFSAAQSATISYLGAAGRHLLLTQVYQDVRLQEFPATSLFLTVQRSRGQSKYQALQLQYQRRLHKGLQVMASYTLAKAQDNASSDAADAQFSTGQHFQPQVLSRSDFDVRHLASIALSYELPALSMSTLARAVTSDWSVDGLWRARSGQPLTLNAGSTLINGVFVSQRPDMVTGQPSYIDDPAAPTGRRLNPSAFTLPPPNVQGTSPRNAVEDYGAWQLDLALRREITLPRRLRLQVRGELFNALNHPNFGGINVNIADTTFGRPSSMLNRSLGGLNALYQMGGPRSGEVAVKLLF